MAKASPCPDEQPVINTDGKYLFAEIKFMFFIMLQLQYRITLFDKQIADSRTLFAGYLEFGEVSSACRELVI